MSSTAFPYEDEAKRLACQGKIHEALNCYDRALKTHPDNDMLLNSKAIALITLGRFEEALVHCRRAASINPNSADIWTNMGVTLEKLNRLTEAADAFERAVEINPYDCYARALLGIVYQKLSREDMAAAQNRKLQELMFPNEYAGFLFGTAAFLLGLLLGGIRGVEDRLFVVSTSSQVIILFFFCLICILYWKSLLKLNEIHRNVIIVPYRSPVEGDRSSRGMYVVLAIMIFVFIIGILAGSDVWNWMH